MRNFPDFITLHKVLREVYEKVPPEARRDYFAQGVEAAGFTKEQASLYASTVLRRNEEDSADSVRQNGFQVCGSWVRGEQHGSPSAWLSTMKETWRFDYDLTYEHKIERYEGYVSSPSPYLESSYSRPSETVDRGIWAPPDWIQNHLDMFVMSVAGNARSLAFKWVDNDDATFRSCTIDGDRFSRE